MYVMQCVVGILCESLCSCGIVTVGGCVCAVVIVHERKWTVWRRNTVMVCGVCNGKTIGNKKSMNGLTLVQSLPEGERIGEMTDL